MNDHFSGLGVYTTIGQVAILLALALRELPHGPARQECLDFIYTKRWLNIQTADIRPYPSASEPRWHTMMSWARESLATKDLVDRSIKDCWRSTKDGVNAAVLIRQQFSEAVLDVRRCYMWTAAFKLFMHPAYISSEHDTPRPALVYVEGVSPD